MDVFLPFNNEASVYPVMEWFTRGIHRVPITDKNKHITHILSQSDVINFLSKQIEKHSFGANKKINDLGLMKKQVFSISQYSFLNVI